GYDPAALYAPSRAYGRPDDLRALVDAAHQRGLAVLLDVIHNHLGPDGAYAAVFMPFLTDAHETPWGRAVNLDDTDSDGVRAFLIDNALHWLEEYHLDGFRLDAVHALYDERDTHFLAELSEAVATVGGPDRHLIAEDYLNDHTLVLPRSEGGLGLDATWTDDPHHILRHLLTGDRTGIFAPFAGTAAPELAEALEQGWYYDGKPSHATGKPFGTSTDPVEPTQVVIYIQNHDQVGNRPTGARLHHQVPLPVYRAASALLLLAPAVPLLFMGQEWATTAPFQFFSDHHTTLGQQVRAGRERLFADWTPPPAALPDPQDPATFARSRLRWQERDDAPHAHTLALYRDLLRWRQRLDGPATATAHDTHSLTLTRGAYSLLTTLRDGATIPLPDEAEILLHTEQPAYAPSSCPPEVGSHTVHFPVAGAMLIRSG
ncbi:MAG: malto-oligosyltrehalose trehalohydrolase, partial [Bacteroidetes bacterium]|nr:malto-oligosyltrehalose trehalohydrolase [Bacteroidota bacterium]